MSKTLLFLVLIVSALMVGCLPTSSPPSEAKMTEADHAADSKATQPSSTTVSAAKPQPSAENTPPVAVAPLPAAPPPSQAAMKSAAPVSKELTIVPDALRPASQPTDRENYAAIEDNPVKRAAEQPVSTFSIDVDTGAYANVRRLLNSGQLPPHHAVRIEEMINYFDYDYPLPENRQPPFRVSTELAPTPWNPKTLLLAIGIKGYDVPKNTLPPANLVFLIDVSGSMEAPNKLELLKSALTLLVRQLRPEDKVAIAVYAGAAGVVLEPTSGNQKAQIETALSRLSAGGSTNGGAGIDLAYRLAREGFVKNGVNRVILATDGDFNVGTVNFDALKNKVETERKSGIALTTLGFGTGNYNDHLMEQLADVGNGHYAYIDTLQEANKVLVDQMSATLLTIAKDVKIQIEFNPTLVEEYRLIGYENRLLQREDFNNDAVDAGDIGAGHTVTALYEVALKGSGGHRNDPLRYQPSASPSDTAARQTEVAFLRLRYKEPDKDTSQLQEWPIHREHVISDWRQTSDRFRFAAAVAGFGQLLRGGRYTTSFGYDDVLTLARHARGADPFGYRGEFLALVGLARSLDQGKPDGNSGQAIR